MNVEGFDALDPSRMLLRRQICRTVLDLRSILRHSTKAIAMPSASAVEFPALVYDAAGEPEDVLKLRDLPAAQPKPQEVQVRWLRSPINPSDVNTVQGKYPLQPKLPGAVPGHEGVGEVVAKGSEVSLLEVGDHVVPLQPALGTWRRLATYPATSLHAVAKELPLETAAQLCINPASALAMLETVVELQPGDSVIQNGATSAVGQLVIQLAKAKGIKTINVMRDRPNWDETVQHLTDLGADLVTTEEKLVDDLKASGLKSPRLGLNCIGGSAATAVAKALGDGGTLATYGGMSMQPVSASTALMIFKDIKYVGFWLSGRLANQQGAEGRSASLDKLAQMFLKGELKAPQCKAYPLEQFKEAFVAAKSGFRGHKVVLEP